MSSGHVCRVCLHGNMKLDPMESIPLLNIYERLTNNQFKKDDRPTAFCPFCYQKLLKCYTFFSMAWRAENLFDQLLLQGVKEFVTKLKLGVTQHMTMAPMQSVTVIDSSTLVTPKEIKEEPKSEIEPEEMEITVKSEAVCRMCLADNLMLNPLDSGPLLDVYQKLTTLQFNSEDGRPRSVCPFCYQKLLKCYTFSKMASRSEELFDRLVLNGIKEISDELVTRLKLRVEQSLGVNHFQPMAIDTTYNAPLMVAVKKEPIMAEEEEYTEENRTGKSGPLILEECKKRGIIKQTPPVTFDCSTCDKKYQTAGSLKRHMKKHIDNEEIFICDICNKQLRYKQSLELHLKCHSDDNKIACTVCNKKFRNKHHLLPHMRTHTGEKPFPCTVCQKRFNTKGHLHKHIMAVHTGTLQNRERRFSCKECNKKIYTLQNLKKHMLVHTGEKPFPCSMCDKRYQTKFNLDIHQKQHNKDLPPLACDICDKRFHIRSKMRKHLSTHNKTIESKIFECRVCHERCALKKDLITHMRLLHPKQSLYACNDCDKQYNKKAHLIRHISVHEGKQFSCDICDRKFKNKNYIIGHMKIHTGDTPFACTLCTKKYTQNYILKKHMRVKHNVK